MAEDNTVVVFARVAETRSELDRHECLGYVSRSPAATALGDFSQDGQLFSRRV